jgi:hypothetical protein
VYLETQLCGRDKQEDHSPGWLLGMGWPLASWKFLNTQNLNLMPLSSAVHFTYLNLITANIY